MDVRIEALRGHWDERYARPGRVPLDEPHEGFVDWIGQFDDDRPVLVVGDGEGRNARAVPERHPVTMVELSEVGAQVCRERSRRPMEVVVADAFTWLAAREHVWPLVAMLYVGPLVEDDVAVLVGVLRAAQELGGGFFIEMARPGLPVELQQSLVDTVPCLVTDVSRDDGVERIRLVG